MKNFVWHDAIFESLKVHAANEQNSKNSSVLNISAYPKDDSSARVKFAIECRGVISVSMNCDLDAIEDNALSGNISHGYIKAHKSKNKTLRIHLADGYIEVNCKSVVVDEQS